MLRVDWGVPAPAVGLSEVAASFCNWFGFLRASHECFTLGCSHLKVRFQSLQGILEGTGDVFAHRFCGCCRIPFYEYFYEVLMPMRGARGGGSRSAEPG